MHRDRVSDRIMKHRKCNEETRFYHSLIDLLDRRVLQARILIVPVVVVDQLLIIDYYLLISDLLLLEYIKYSSGDL